MDERVEQNTLWALQLSVTQSGVTVSSVVPAIPTVNDRQCNHLNVIITAKIKQLSWFMDSVWSHLLFSHMLLAEGSKQKRKATNQFRTPAATVAAPKGSTHRPHYSRGLEEDGKMTGFYPALLCSIWALQELYTAGLIHPFIQRVFYILFLHKCFLSYIHILMNVSESTSGLVSCPSLHAAWSSQSATTNFQLVDDLLLPELQPQMEKLQLLIHSGDRPAVITTDWCCDAGWPWQDCQLI